MHLTSVAVGVALLLFSSRLPVAQAAGIADFDPFTSPNGEGCADPEGFNACFQDAIKDFVDCGENWCPSQQLESNTECLSGCKTTQLRSNLFCWVQSCWNQIYSCEYQATAIEFLARAPNSRKTVSGGIPGYPAPDGAPGACSCNLGHVEGNATTGIALLNGCFPLAIENSEAGLECTCCASSVVVSGFGICPGVDLTFMDLNVAEAEKSVNVELSQDNCAILTKDNGAACEAYNVSLGIYPEIINPNSLPAQGTVLPTNLPGDSFTAPPQSVVSVSLDDLDYTTQITLASWKNEAGPVTATGSGDAPQNTGARDSEDGDDEDATSTGEAAGKETGKNAAGRVAVQNFLPGTVFVTLLLCALF